MQGERYASDKDAYGAEPNDFLVAREAERDIHEGRYHNGPSTIVQILGVKPEPQS
jgi:hypothetical protein